WSLERPGRSGRSRAWALIPADWLNCAPGSTGAARTAPPSSGRQGAGRAGAGRSDGVGRQLAEQDAQLLELRRGQARRAGDEARDRTGPLLQRGSLLSERDQDGPLVGGGALPAQDAVRLQALEQRGQRAVV